MKYIISVILVWGLVTSSWASGQRVPDQNGNKTTAYGGSAYAGANQAQGQLQGQLQGQVLSNQNSVSGSNHQNQSASSNSNQSLANTNDLSNRQRTDQSNSQSMVYNESDGVRYSGGYKVRSAPPVSLGTAMPTAGCYVTHGVSGSGIGFGFGVNTATYDKECEIREVVRISQSSTDPETHRLADIVLQDRLLGYVNERKAKAELEASSKSRANIFELTNY
jgi:hypothetical protein